MQAMVTAVLGLQLLSPQAGREGPPTAAMLALQARNGVTPDAAALVTEAAVDEIRGQKAFARVTSWSELQQLLTLEQAKQLSDCGGESCVAEVMGALDVDYAIMGSVGRLGRHTQVTLNLLHVRTSTARSSVAIRACADDEGTVLLAIRPAVRNMLAEARLVPGPPVALPPSLTECADPNAPKVKDANHNRAAQASDGSLRARLRILGALGSAALGLAGAGSLLGGVGVGIGAVAFLARITNPQRLGDIRTGPLEREGRLALLYGSDAAGFALALLLGVAGLIAMAAAVTALVMIFIFGS